MVTELQNGQVGIRTGFLSGSRAWHPGHIATQSEAGATVCWAVGSSRRVTRGPSAQITLQKEACFSASLLFLGGRVLVTLGCRRHPAAGRMWLPPEQKESELWRRLPVQAQLSPLVP